MTINYLFGSSSYGVPKVAKGEYQLCNAAATITLLDTSLLNPGTAGYVDHIWLGNNSASNHDSFESAELKVFLNGSASATIDVNLGALFMTPWSSSLVYDGGTIGFQWQSSNTGSGYLKIKMPFDTSIKLTLTNGGAASCKYFWVISYKLTPSFAINWGRAKKLKIATLFGTSVVKYTNQVIASDSGRGLIYGWTAVFKGGDSNVQFLEGNPSIKIDGESSASCVWSGTEDYFLNGEYFYGGAVARPDHGTGVITAGSGLVATYRFHLDDPIPFDTAFEFDWPNGDAAEATVVNNTLLYTALYYYLSA